MKKENKLFRMVNWLNDIKKPFTRLQLTMVVDGGPANLVLALEHFGYAEKIPGHYGWYKMLKPITYENASRCLTDYKTRQTKINITTEIPMGVEYEVIKTIDELQIENKKIADELANLKMEHDKLLDQYTDLYHDYIYCQKVSWQERKFASLKNFFQRLFV